MNKKRFVLTRKNQKGQVAIFVALIFQVVFVFFAILINVGLLVHHKINLQQSTDLAAYYGAMKQADIMNMISHVNFQMRQAWKLLTWRYRVVGTFGFQDWDSGRALNEKIHFPLDISLTGGFTAFDPASQNYTCPDGVNPLDVPFFCAGHRGFSNWTGDNENNCRLNCKHINNTITTIKGITIQRNPVDTNGTDGIIKNTNIAMGNVNTRLENLCGNLGPKSLIMMAKFLMAYESESRQKKALIQMLGSNLSLTPDKALDLEGGLIKEGAKKTFDNNLTEANKSGESTFEVVNGLSQGGCGFTGAGTDGKADNNQFMTEILLPVVQFFIHTCTPIADPNQPTFNFSPQSLYKDSNFNSVNPVLQGIGMDKIDDATFAQINARIQAIQYVVGFEKNPWCVVYYGAKAQSEPKIPFLPISKIKLSAISFAKPFGGSIGPRYKQKWSSGSRASDLGAMTDPNLPVKSGPDLAALTPLKQAIATFPNYANYVGDNLGLKNAEVLATYQEILLHRELSFNENSTLHISKNKNSGAASEPKGITSATTWPGDSNWSRMIDPDSNSYDYLATEGDKNSFLRDLELTVMAPNQFDLTYYSIDPDFYNNYYMKLKGGSAGPLTFPGSLDKIRAQVGGYGPKINEFRMDYGFNESLINDIAINYSVRHQIAVAAKVVKPITRLAETGFNGRSVASVLGFIPDKPSSLLTGWTFQNFSNYSLFPSLGPDVVNTMTFGKCSDEKWNKSSVNDIVANYDSPVTTGLPPTPGNCVWGGRTGYSVKIVSPSMIRDSSPAQSLGGDGTSGQLLNGLGPNFFVF